MKEKTKEKIISISQTVLLVVGAAGFIATAAVAPNAIQLFKHFGPLKKDWKIKTYELNLNINRLIERGLIKIKEDRTHEFLEITDKGKRVLLKYKLEGLSKERPKNWDKKYRVVIFDIAEQNRKTRDKLRIMLRSFGFICLQGSVWVYPYHCEEIISLLKEYLHLGTQVVYMTVDSIENDRWLKKSFDL